MDSKFLNDVQDAGWHIEEVSEDAATCRCPADGCRVRAKLAYGVPVPPVRSADRHVLDVAVSSFVEFREVMRQRRQGLQLSISELEEVSGMATDHLAKFEGKLQTRVPNLDIAMEWAQALGYEIVLRPTRLPRKGLSYISDTRSMTESRKRRNAQENARRKA